MNATPRPNERPVTAINGPRGRSAAGGGRPVAVLGLLHAGLALTRAFGRRGIPVSGIALKACDFGLHSRYLTHSYLIEDEDQARRDARTLSALRDVAADGRLVLFAERDEHVAFVLRNWEAVHEIADTPLPGDPDAVWRLRRKERLVEEAERAGVPAPRTVLASSEEAVRGAGLRPPFLVKPVEGQEFALAFGEKAVVANTAEEAVAAWRRARSAGFETMVQELIPDSHERVFSLLAYISAEAGPLACVVGRKVRQGPLRFGTSAFFEVSYERRVLDAGLRLLTSAGYTGLAHVEFAHDPRDDTYKLLEVNTRPPVWVGIALNPSFDIGRVAYDDLCGHPPVACRLYRDDLSWAYLAKDAYVSYQMARRGELRPGELVAHYLRPHKVRAVFARDDLRPALASLAYLRSRV